MTTNKNEIHDNALTYKQLLDLYLEKLKLEDKKHQQAKNAKSALNSWLNALNLQIEQKIGGELGKDFEIAIESYIKFENRRLKNKSTYSSRVSILRHYKDIYLNNLQIADLPTSFSERLKYFLKLKGYTIARLHEKLPESIKYDRLVNWTSGKNIPNSATFWVVEMLEKQLVIKPGMLLCTLPRSVISNTQKSVGKSILQYSVWNEKLNKDFLELVKFKSSISTPLGMKRERRGWTGAPGELPKTAHLARETFKHFFGFLCLSKNVEDPKWCGLGMKKSELSLAHLTDIDLLEKYINTFMLSRSEKIYHHGFLSTLQIFKSLNRKEFGYLFQKPELAAEINLAVDKNQWQKRCLATYRRLSEIFKDIKNLKKIGDVNFRYSRNPCAGIDSILNLSDPLSVIMKMISTMAADIEKLSHARVMQAFLFRDLVLISLLQVNPLRISMYQKMEFEKNLIKEKDGSWWIQFDRSDFKNRRSLKSDYRVQVAKEIWRMIDDYKNTYRPRLKASGKSNAVFPFCRDAYIFRDGYFERTGSYLSEIVFKRTKQYIPDCIGFRPNSFRHLSATHTIKRDPAFGCVLAAKTLNDKQETIEENYAHLKTNDFYEPYNAMLSDLWKSHPINLPPPDNNEDEDEKI